MNKLMKVDTIKNVIFELRGRKIMLDKDIARLYGVVPFRMREQVKRNKERFPEDFMFQLNDHEIELMVSQNAIPSRKWLGGHKPYAFTRNGVNMLAAVLRSQTAIDRSIFIMRAFSVLEESIGKRKDRMLSSPAVMKELSVHSRAIMRLFQEVNVNKKQIGSIERLQKEMGKLIQKIILASLK
jgi:ORF6N domain